MTEKDVAKIGVFKGPSPDALHLLNAILETSPQRMVSDNQVMIILDALAGAQDPALVARFPAVLAICARRGIELDSQSLFARYWEASPKRQNLEKLLLVSAELFLRERIPAPNNLSQIAETLKARHALLLSADAVPLVNGPTVAVADMYAALKQFAGDLRKPVQPQAQAPAVRRQWSPQLERFLDLLFSDKQKELVYKRLKGHHLTKTEREYYSRVVKKKLAAVADPEMQELAGLLVPEDRRPPGGRRRPDKPLPRRKDESSKP
ncbi:MAG: hypothetical protein HY895_02725 [Deltaproteobacteria bacterium]|nr:hypothetical protein [Deltaproteobacteria bacterium]